MHLRFATLVRSFAALVALVAAAAAPATVCLMLARRTLIGTGREAGVQAGSDRFQRRTMAR